MCVASELLRSQAEQEATQESCSSFKSSSPVNEREINNIYAELRQIKQTQDIHFRTLVGYIIVSSLTVISIMTGFGVTLLTKIQ